MPTLTKALVLSLTLVTSFAPEASAADDKVKIKADFDAWFKETNAQFEKSWAAIQEAEAAARPTYEKGVKLAEQGKQKKAAKTLLDARAKLFNHKQATFVHVNKGLSHSIALPLASIYDDTDDEALLKREIVFMDKGRAWLSKEEEQKIFMHHAMKDCTACGAWRRPKKGASG